MNTDLKITFAPGCFDDFDGTQEELDNMIATITKTFETGNFLENGISIREIESNTSEEEWAIMDAEDELHMNNVRVLH